MNFNSNDTDALTNEYKLFRDTTHELTQLYGIRIKYIFTHKINQDNFLGEHSHIKIDNNSTFEFYVRPEDTSMWEGDDNTFSKFGMQSLDVMNIYVPRVTMEEIHPEIVNREGKFTIENIPNGNLVVFDNNKIMEVTNFKLHSSEFGNNNMFTSDRNKNVYKLTLKSYIFNHDEISEATNITTSEHVEYSDFGNLESIFGVNEINEEEVRHQAEDIIMEDEVIYPNPVRQKPIRVKEDEKNPFGDFG